jgi:acetyl-CoA carboxylase biotin carboxylase subunit
MFSKILIANRGEIALRILRACKEMNIKTVAVYSEADANAMHVKLSDESVCIGPNASQKSYLNIPAILSAADITGAEAIHPGVGFLSENASFASIVEEHGMVFIGPKPEHIKMMGDKITAKATMIELGIPVIPGAIASLDTDEIAMEEAVRIGFPVLIKATAGGGGKGMKIAFSKDDIPSAFALARSEAKLFFGNDQVYMERYLKKPRHIEVQVLCDSHGQSLHLGERDCSIQRRHQKIWEEAPSPGLDEEMREKLGKIVAKAMSKMGYRGVGTLEFLFEDGDFFFMEMNTRIQVEHPITELVTGIDLIKEQIRVAAGHKLTYKQKDIKMKGHAIECRINAEDPHTFTPSPGTIERYHVPGGPNVRIDSHLYQGYKVPQYYDSMVSKLIAYGNTRQECIATLKRAIGEYIIDGISTTLPLHAELCNEPDIRAGDYDIHWLEKFLGKKSLG